MVLHYMKMITAEALERCLRDGTTEVNVAPEIGLPDQSGQSMIPCQVDFAEILAHLGRNIVEVQFGVNFFFGFARDRRSAIKCG